MAYVKFAKSDHQNVLPCFDFVRLASVPQFKCRIGAKMAVRVYFPYRIWCCAARQLPQHPLWLCCHRGQILPVNGGCEGGLPVT